MTGRSLLAAAAVALAATAAAQPPADPLPAGTIRLGTGRRVPQIATLVPPNYTRYVATASNGRPGPAGDVATPPPYVGVGVPPDPPVVSADGRRAAGGTEPHVVVWDIASGRTVRDIPPPKGLTAARAGGTAYAALSADGRVFARSYYGSPTVGRVLVRDVDKDEVVGDIPVPAFTAVALSPDGGLLAVWSAVSNPPPPGSPVDPRTTVRVLDARTGQEKFRAPTTPAEGAVATVAFSPDGKLMAVGTASGPIDLWDAATGTRVRVLLGVTTQGLRLGFSPDGGVVAAVSATAVTQRWAVADGRLLGTTPPPPVMVRGIPRAVALRSADDGVVWADGPGLVIWEVPSGRVVSAGADEHAGPVLDATFAPGGAVVTAGIDRRIIRWDATAGRRLDGVVPKVPPTGPPPGLALRVRLLPASGRALLSDPGRSGVYDLATGDEVAAVPTGGRPGDGLARHFTSAAGGRVVTAFTPGRAGQPGSWAVWDAVAGRLAGRADGVDGASGVVAADVSPSGRRLVTLAQSPGRLDMLPPLTLAGWDVTTGRRLSETVHPGFVRAVTVAAVNDHAALLAGADGRVLVLDYEAGRFGDEIVGPAGTAHVRPPPVAVAADGKHVAVGGPAAGVEADAVRVYDWPRGRVVATLRGNRARASALAFSPDGRQLAVGTEDGTVLIRAIDTGAK